jgi:very-short-patch-repair endonuclease/predicted transcriptional regulator of viral defense system
MDARIITIAARQHSVLTRAQATHAGVTDADIDRLIRRRLLVPVHRNVYRVAAVPATPRTDAMAAVLAAESAALPGRARTGWGFTASHWTAAALWNFAPDGVRDRAHVIGERHCRARGISAHRMVVPAAERTVLQGIPVTTPARTILDLAAIAGTRELEQAHAVAERVGAVRRRRLWALLDRHRAARGSVLLRQLLTELDASGLEPLFLRSRAEEEALAMIISGGLPRPATNVRILGLEVDFLWADLRLVMEVDGLEFHSSAEAMQRDRARDRTLLRGGYLVLRFTWHQLTRERDECLATLASTVGARQQLLALGALRTAAA